LVITWSSPIDLVTHVGAHLAFLILA